MVQKTLYYETSNSLSHHGIKGQKWGVRRFQNKDGTLTAKGKKRYADDSENIKNMSNDELRARINRLRNEQRYSELTRKHSNLSDVLDLVEDGSGVASKGANTAKEGLSLRLSKNKMKNMSKDELADFIDKHNKTKTGFETVSKAAQGTAESARLVNKLHKKISETEHDKEAMEKARKMSDDELRRTVERLDLERQYSSVNNKSTKRGMETTLEILAIVGSVVTIANAGIGVANGIKALKG